MYQDGITTPAVGDHIRGATAGNGATDGYVCEVMGGGLLRIAKLTTLSEKASSFKGPALAVGAKAFVVDELVDSAANFNKVA